LLSGSIEDTKQLLLLVSGIVEPLLVDDDIDGDDGVSGLTRPMISSRCPQPISTMEATALTQVSIGSHMERRGMMPGALTPTYIVFHLKIDRAFPSIVFPRASTTRPSRP
ncbi:hypothetical protein PFISCL1PPCAC_24275, partial [Pristionchus fissidentatus]